MHVPKVKNPQLQMHVHGLLFNQLSFFNGLESYFIWQIVRMDIGRAFSYFLLELIYILFRGLILVRLYFRAYRNWNRVFSSMIRAFIKPL